MQYPKQEGETATYWRVFYTAPRAEKKCESDLDERGINVFLPKLATIRQWKDRKKRIEEPLFPSYIFAQVDERDRLRVLQTPGIVRTVSFGGQLAVVSDEEIEQLKIAQRDPERLFRMANPLPEIGEVVEIDEGPFKGLRGEVLDFRGDVYVVIRINAIRQAVRIQIPHEIIRRLKRSNTSL